MPLIRKGGGALPGSQGDDAAPTDALRGGNGDERWASARSLSGQPEAVSELGAALSAETDPRVREAILTALTRIGTPQSAEAILPLIHRDDASARRGAIDALRAMPEALAAHLDGLLSAPDPDVRLLACDLARELPPADGERALCALLRREPEVNVCAAAMDALAECGGAEALPILASCAERFVDVPFLVFAAKIASERIRAQAPPQDG